MLEFLTGWIIGRNTKPQKTIDINDNRPIEEQLGIPKVYKYVALTDITDCPATLDNCYNDYENTNLVAIHKNGHIYYYLQVYVYDTQLHWGDEELLENI